MYSDKQKRLLYLYYLLCSHISEKNVYSLCLKGESFPSFIFTKSYKIHTAHTRSPGCLWLQNQHAYFVLNQFNWYLPFQCPFKLRSLPSNLAEIASKVDLRDFRLYSAIIMQPIERNEVVIVPTLIVILFALNRYLPSVPPPP